MSQTNRLSSGGRIDRNKVLTFTFNGQSYKGYEGDSLAAALLANGVDIIGRSFKYSRPRGIFAAGAEEPNAVLQIGATEATQIPTCAPRNRRCTRAWSPPAPTAGRTSTTT
jgi:sarcosine oxidase subunit alpha